MLTVYTKIPKVKDGLVTRGENHGLNVEYAYNRIFKATRFIKIKIIFRKG